MVAESGKVNAGADIFSADLHCSSSQGMGAAPHKLVTGSRDGVLALSHVTNTGIQAQSLHPVHDRSVKCVSISGDGQSCVSTGNDYSVRVCNALFRVVLTHLKKSVQSVLEILGFLDKPVLVTVHVHNQSAVVCGWLSCLTGSTLVYRSCGIKTLQNWGGGCSLHLHQKLQHNATPRSWSISGSPHFLRNRGKA